jgi:hypothetical protein
MRPLLAREVDAFPLSAGRHKGRVEPERPGFLIQFREQHARFQRQ